MTIYRLILALTCTIGWVAANSNRYSTPLAAVSRESSPGRSHLGNLEYGWPVLVRRTLQPERSNPKSPAKQQESGGNSRLSGHSSPEPQPSSSSSDSAGGKRAAKRKSTNSPDGERTPKRKSNAGLGVGVIGPEYPRTPDGAISLRLYREKWGVPLARYKSDTTFRKKPSPEPAIPKKPKTPKEAAGPSSSKQRKTKQASNTATSKKRQIGLAPLPTSQGGLEQASTPFAVLYKPVDIQANQKNGHSAFAAVPRAGQSPGVAKSVPQQQSTIDGSSTWNRASKSK